MRHFIWISLLTVLGLPSVALADYWVESRTQADGGADVVVAWDTDSAVEYRLGSGVDEAMADAVAAAFQTWQDVDCAAIEFARGDDVADPMPRHWMFLEGQFIQVWWVDDPSYWEYAQVGRADWVHDGNGVIVGADIILNAHDHSWSTTGEADKMDVQSVVTALIGKSLGIQSDSEDSAVYGSYSPGNTDKRTLGDDDVAALQYIYGDGSCTPPDPAGICPDTGPGEDCGPPDPDTDPADGGTAMPYDAGTSGGTDAGSTAGDGGVGTTGGGDDDGGCSVTAAGSSSGSAIAWLAVGLLLVVGLGRRRRN